MFDRFGIVMVVVSNMARSVAFYRDALGLHLTMESPDWSEFDVGGVSLGLHAAGPTLSVNPAGGVSFGFYTRDIDGTLAEITRRGAKLLGRTDEQFGILALIADPDGYSIQICQLAHG